MGNLTKQEANKFLEGTKVYVNGRSKEIQEFAFNLGWKWLDNSTKIQYVEDPFFYFKDGKIQSGVSMLTFKEACETEISCEQILNIRIAEPTKSWEELKKIGKIFIGEPHKISIAVKNPSLNLIDLSKNTFIDIKHAKSALAMAQISNLMPCYGGAITDEEWCEGTLKYIILRSRNNIAKGTFYDGANILAFHTEVQRNAFLTNNEQLVRDYLML